MKDPALLYDSPQDVVDSEELTREQKIALLEEWKDEVKHYLIAEEEAMPGDPDNAERLRQISDALIALREQR